MAYTRGKLITIALTAKANEQKLNLREVTKLSGIKEGKATEWLKESSEPTDEDVEAICNYLGCSVEEINKMVETNIAKTKIYNNAEDTKEEMPSKVKETEKKSSKVSTLNNTKRTKEKLVKGIEMENKTEDLKATKSIKLKALSEQKLTSSKPTEKTIKAKSAEKPSKKASGKKTILSEESEAYIRKTVGLKKSESIDSDAIITTFNLTTESIKQNLDRLINLEKDITNKLYETLESNSVEPKLQKLIETANNASEEGIDIAITILKKWRK